MVDQHAVSGGRRVDGNGRNATILILKAQMARRVLVEGERALERSVPHGQHDVVHRRLAEDFVHFVFRDAGHVLAVDLENLVAESQSAHRGRAVASHEAYENAFVDGFHLETDTAVSVFAEDDL